MQGFENGEKSMWQDLDKIISEIIYSSKNLLKNTFFYLEMFLYFCFKNIIFFTNNNSSRILIQINF